MRPGVKGTVTAWPAFLRRLLDARATGQNDQVRQGYLLAAGRYAVERALDALQGLEHLRQLGRLVDFPILLRRQAKAGAVGAAALVGATEGGRRGPGGRNQLRHGQATSQDLALERSDVLCLNQLVIDGRDGVLPDDLFGRDLRTEIACARAHVAVCQLEPRPGERVGELIRILVEASRYLLVDRIEPQSEVRGQHRGRVTLGRVVRIRNLTGAGTAFRSPLMRAGRALGQFPFVAEQVSGRSCYSTSWAFGSR